MTTRSLSSRMTAGSAALLAVVLAANTALAQASPEDRTTAEALFVEAKRLMEANNFAEACPRLADSQRLDPAVGTLLNLGLCYKSMGRTASAWSTYREAAAAARNAGQADRETIARDEADALEPKLSRLTVTVVPPSAALPDLKITVDGAELPRGVWSVASPVDPGQHVVEAAATGKKPWRGEIAVGLEADAKSIEVPLLEDAPAAPAPPAVAVSSIPPAPRDKPNKTLRIVGYASAGVGLAAVGVGAYFGVKALGLKKDSDDECTDGLCSSSGLANYEDAQTAGIVADVLYGVGVVGIGVGTYLVLSNGGVPWKKEEKTATSTDWKVAGGFGPGGGAVAVKKAW